MRIELLPTAADEKPALAELIRLYHYDLSKCGGADAGALLCSDHAPLDTGSDALSCHVFLIHVDEQLAGFALVDRMSRLHNPFDGHAVADFFILRRYRRQGIGRASAMALFDRFPGHWEVSACARNVPGHVFWRGVVDRYTDGHYAETWVQTASWRGPVQSFYTPLH